MQFWLTGSAVAVMLLIATLPFVHSQSPAGVSRFGAVAATVVAAVWFGWVLPSFPGSSQGAAQTLAMPVGAAVVVMLGITLLPVFSRRVGSPADPLGALDLASASFPATRSDARQGSARESRLLASPTAMRDLRYDTVTGLPGRVLLVDRIGVMIARARRTHESVAFAIIQLAVAGQRKGFELPSGAQLCEAGGLLTMALREEDTVACLQPDRLAVIARITPESGPEVLEARLRSALSAFAASNGVDVRMGTALFPEQAAYVAQLVSCAEQNLEAAEPF